jgi:hypothetical protein
VACMMIQIERSGGFAGITKTIIVDTKKLPKDMANNIEKHLIQTKLSNGRSYSMKSGMADCYFYKISTSVKNKKKEIEFREFGIDNEFRATINFLFRKYSRASIY